MNVGRIGAPDADLGRTKKPFEILKISKGCLMSKPGERISPAFKDACTRCGGSEGAMRLTASVQRGASAPA